MGEWGVVLGHVRSSLRWWLFCGDDLIAVIQYTWVYLNHLASLRCCGCAILLLSPGLLQYCSLMFVLWSTTHNTSTSTLIGLKITELKNYKPGTVYILQQHIFLGGFILVSLQRCALHALLNWLWRLAGWTSVCARVCVWDSLFNHIVHMEICNHLKVYIL